ncbi:hypothetical protein [Methylocella tundrae]|uniref:Uncharacterized protein n=1 Tax=Methylocella tundrae TaxID=227605 RepID=A0A4U8Z7W3_METTU|nr:hypothetical protein [Methylocella tundrae]WPP02646.1 hypothetical protein SIN04_00575 [Methylocella tundrae]VFU17682.1 conserved protein of unknown function [Methylocella tundrae]
MELVTLAHATLNRIGSASATGMVKHTEVRRVGEVPDGSPEALRELVMTIAEEHGEPRESLQMMRQENGWHYTQQRDAVVFNIQGRNVQYSTPYAICYAHPALKIGERYFKLDEVKC